MLALVESLTVDRQGRDAVIALKIHLLPEQVISVGVLSARHIKDRPLGVDALTPRELAVLHTIGQGKSHKEIAQIMKTGIANSYTLSMRIRRCLGVRNLRDAYTLAQKRIERQLSTLPLGSSGRCKIGTREVPVLSPAMLEVLPLLARAAPHRRWRA